MARGFFDQKQLNALNRALSGSGLDYKAYRPLMLSEVDPDARVRLPSQATPHAQLVSDLIELNRDVSPAGRPDALATWLEQARILVIGRPGVSQVLDDFARRCRVDVAQAPGLAPRESIDPDAAVRMAVEARAAGRLSVVLGPAVLRPHGWAALARSLCKELGYTHIDVVDVARLAGLAVTERTLHAGRLDARRQVWQSAARVLAETATREDDEALATTLERLGPRMRFTLLGDPAVDEVLRGIPCEGDAALGGRVGDDAGWALTDLDLLTVAVDRPVEFEALAAAFAHDRLIVCLGFGCDDLAHLEILREALDRGSEAVELIAVVVDGDEQAWARVERRLGARVCPVRCGWSRRLDGWRWFADAVDAVVRGVVPPPRPAEAQAAHPRMSAIAAAIADTHQRATHEGLASPLQWFRDWRPDRQLTTRHPPQHPLLGNVFVEREDYDGHNLREMLREQVLGGGKAGLTGLLGMGGVGKTYLALKLAHQLVDEDGWQIAWVSLLDQGTEDALVSIVDCFGLTFVDGLDLDEKAAAIRHLVDHVAERGGRILVVLDNAEKFPDLRKLLTQIERLPVLVTSRTEECNDLVEYHRLGQLGRDEARQLCQQFLGSRDRGRYARLTAEDHADLDALCSDVLGGHPLAIQMILSGYVNLPYNRRAGRRPFRRILEDVRAAPLDRLEGFAYAAGGVTGEHLHRNIRATFDWLFGELPEVAEQLWQGSADGGYGAQQLLPLVASIGHQPVTEAQIARAAGRLFQHILTTIDDPFAGLEPHVAAPCLRGLPGWVRELGQATETDALSAALGVLCGVSLLDFLDPVDGRPGRYRVHPLVREFAFDARREDRIRVGDGDASTVLAGHGPTLDALYTSAIEELSADRARLDSYLDILRRLRGRFAPTKLACNKLIEEAYQPDVGQLDTKAEMLRLAAELAGEVGLDEEHGILLAKAGELRVRLGHHDGYAMMRVAIERLDPTQERQALARLWSRCFVAEGHIGHPTLRASVEELVSLLRQTWGSPAAFPAQVDLILDAAMPLLCRGPDIQLRRAPLADRVLGNAVLDLTRVLHLWSDRGCPSPELTRCRDLLAQARGGDAGLDTQKGFELEAAITCLAWRRGDLADGEFSQATDALLSQRLASGERGFAIRRRVLQARMEHALAAGRWRVAADHVEAISALLAQQRVALLERDRSLPDIIGWIVRSIGAIEGGGRPDEAEARELGERLRRWGLATHLGWAELALAVVAHDRPEAAVRCAVRARRTFDQMYGAVPPHAAAVYQWLRRRVELRGPLFDAIADRLPAADLVPEILAPWLVQFDRDLPESWVGRDGRPMRLLAAGLQPFMSREHWLTPVYIDAEPVGVDVFERFIRDSGRTAVCLDKGQGPWVVDVAFGEAVAFARWAGKELPLGVDWYAAQWQIAAEGRPERASGWDGAIGRTLDAIDAVVRGDFPQSERSLPSSYETRSSNDRQDDVEALDEAALMAELEDYFSGRWLGVDDSGGPFHKAFLRPLAESVSRDLLPTVQRAAIDLALTLLLPVPRRVALLRLLPQSPDLGDRLSSHLTEARRLVLVVAERGVDEMRGYVRRARSARATWAAVISLPAAQDDTTLSGVDGISRADFESEAEAHFQGAWLQASPALEAVYRERVMGPIRQHQRELGDDEAKALSLGLTTSISLDLGEKERILRSMPKLRVEQARQLIQIFTEEQGKFRAMQSSGWPQTMNLFRVHRQQMSQWLMPEASPADEPEDGDAGSGGGDDPGASTEGLAPDHASEAGGDELARLLSGDWLDEHPAVRDRALDAVARAWRRHHPDEPPPTDRFMRDLLCTPRWTTAQRASCLAHLDRYSPAELDALAYVLEHDRVGDSRPEGWLAMAREGEARWVEHLAELEPSPLPERSVAPPLPTAVRGRVRLIAHFSGRWVSDSATLSARFQQAVLEPVLANTVGFPPDEGHRFGQGLAVSISLSPDEKHRIVESIPKLGRPQLAQLVGIFDEEREKFERLAPSHVPELVKLCDRHYREFVEFLCPDAVSYRTMGPDTHPPVWSGNLPEGKRVLVGDPFTDRIWRGVNHAPGTGVGIRCVQPVFFTEDFSEPGSDGGG